MTWKNYTLGSSYLLFCMVLVYNKCKLCGYTKLMWQGHVDKGKFIHNLLQPFS